MTRVLVTGASGLLGGAIWRRLAERPDVEARATVRSDLTDAASIANALSAWKPDVVIHAAGRTHGSPDELQAGNAILTRRLAEALVAVAPTARLVLLGSAAQYGPSADQIPWREDAPCHPHDAYGASKLEAERAAFESGAKVTALRIFNVVSPEGSGPQLFPTFLRKAAAAYSGRHPWRIELGPLDAVRDFVSLDDVATTIERAIDRGAAGLVVNVCTGHGRTAGDLVRSVAGQLTQSGIDTNSGGASGLPWSVGDSARCKSLLGFAPSPDLTDLTRRAAEWVKANATADADA